MTNVLRDIVRRREMLANLLARELKARYKGSVLGFLWSILTPLFMAVIYVFFLRLLAGRGVPVEEIIIGVFAWQFTVQSVNTGLNCVTANANLVKKVYFPRMILPAAVTLANLVNFLLSLLVQFAIVVVILVLRNEFLSPWALILPVMIVYHTLFNFSLALLLSSLNVYFRDTQHIVGVALSAWFFLSPVMYNLSFVRGFAAQHAWMMQFYMLNPMAVIISAYRAMILPGAVFPWSWGTLLGLLWPLGLLLAAYALFQRAQKNFADML